MEKICSKCKQKKPYCMFYFDSRKKDGLQSQCKSCFKVRNEKNKEQRKLYNELWKSKNKEQIKQYSKKYYEENHERIKESAKKYHADNAEKAKKRMKDAYWADPKKSVARSKQWKKENSFKVNAINANRRAMQLNATPKWANLSAIKIEYELAAWCSKVMSEPYHVDHIIPLKGETVCGLHVETNLRVIRGKENVAKSNKFEVL